MPGSFRSVRTKSASPASLTPSSAVPTAFTSYPLEARWRPITRRYLSSSSITAITGLGMFLSLCHRQVHPEHTAFPRRTFHCDASGVLVDDLVAYREP